MNYSQYKESPMLVRKSDNQIKNKKILQLITDAKTKFIESLIDKIYQKLKNFQKKVAQSPKTLPLRTSFFENGHIFNFKELASLLYKLDLTLNQSDNKFFKHMVFFKERKNVKNLLKCLKKIQLLEY